MWPLFGVVPYLAFAVSLSAYLQCQLLDVPEQLNVFFRQVLVAGQLLVFVAPVAAFLIVWGQKSRVDIN